MSDTSTHLNLPYILASQAQKHVTHNEAIDILDTVVQLAVAERRGSPPAVPLEGDRYLIDEPATGAWAGHDGQIAHWRLGQWEFIAPHAGFLAWSIDEERLVLWDGAHWRGVAETIRDLQHLDRLGVGTSADADNPFAAKVNKALWTARDTGEGGTGDLRYTLNKSAAGNVLSLLFQSGYSARAEIGLVGTENVSLNVSPNGTDWTTALAVDRSTGLSTVAANPTAALGVATKQYVDSRPASSLQSSAVGSVAATNVQSAIGELDSEKMARGGDSVSGTYNFAGPVNFNNGLTIAGNTPSYTRDATAALFRFINYRDTNGSHVTLVADVARGSQAAPAFMTATGLMLELSVRPFDGSAVGMAVSGRFAFRATENHSSTARGTSMTIELAPEGSSTVQEVASFSANSGLSLFGANPVIDQNRHHRLRSYTAATLPSASVAGQMIRVSDGNAHRQLAVSDGSSWRFPDGAVVS